MGEHKEGSHRSSVEKEGSKLFSFILLYVVLKDDSLF
jgi:hypothetical protein